MMLTQLMVKTLWASHLWNSFHILLNSLILTTQMVMTIWSSHVWNSSSCSLRLTDTHTTHGDDHMIIWYMKLIFMFFETHWYSRHSWWRPYDHLIYETHLNVLWDSLILMPLMVTTIWSSDIWNSPSCSLRLTDTHETHGDDHMIILYMKLILMFLETH